MAEPQTPLCPLNTRESTSRSRQCGVITQAGKRHSILLLGLMLTACASSGPGVSRQTDSGYGNAKPVATGSSTNQVAAPAETAPTNVVAKSATAAPAKPEESLKPVTASQPSVSTKVTTHQTKVVATPPTEPKKLTKKSIETPAKKVAKASEHPTSSIAKAQSSATEVVAKATEKPTKPEPIHTADAQKPSLQTAMVTPAENPPVPAPSAAEEINVTLDSLPLDLGGWTLNRKKFDDAGGATSCYLTSKTVAFNDGYDNSKLFATVRPDQLLITTDSQIDLSYPGVGMKIGEGQLVPFGAIQNGKSVVVKGNYLDRLMQGGTLHIYLGFWPTWPVTQTQQIDLSLDSLKHAAAAFTACSKL